MFRNAFFALLALALLQHSAFAFSMGSASYNVTDAVLATGGNVGSSASYRLDYTTGQPVAGYSTSASYRAYFGRVWQFVAGVTPSMETGVQLDTAGIVVNLGSMQRIFVTVSNGGSNTSVFPLHIGGFDQSKNWAWFTGHRTDANRHDLSVVLGPHEKNTVSIDFFAAAPGTYKLVIGPDNNYNNRYGEVTLKVVHKSKGLLSTTPDIGALAFAFVALAAAISHAFLGKRN